MKSSAVIHERIYITRILSEEEFRMKRFSQIIGTIMVCLMTVIVFTGCDQLMNQKDQDNQENQEPTYEVNDLYSKIAAGETDITYTLTSDAVLRPESNYSNDGNYPEGKDYALEIPSGVKVTIKTDGVPRTLGISVKCGAMIKVAGTLIIQENVNLSDKPGKVHVNAINIVSGGSVYMNGGSISKISHSGENRHTIQIEAGGFFKMTDGSITGNGSKGAVGVAGSFEMTGGIISKNTNNQSTIDNGGAGGITVYAGGDFTMTGGTVCSNNSNASDGAKPKNLYIYTDGTYNGKKYTEPEEIIFDRTITFNTDGGSPVESQIIKDGQKIVMPDIPTKEGYYFSGWYSGDNVYAFYNAVNSDLNLKARWCKTYNDLYEKIAAGETDITCTLTYDGVLRPESSYSDNGNFYSGHAGKDYALEIPKGVKVTIKTDGVPRTISTNVQCGRVIRVYGTLVIEENVNLSGNVHWGVIEIKSGGTVIMNGGSISGFTYYGSTIQAITVEEGATFKMTGGSIKNNNHGGVSVKGTFEMTGGEISSNSTAEVIKNEDSAYGCAGGVSVYANGVFTYTNGIIKDNKHRATKDGLKHKDLYIFKDGTYNGTKYTKSTEIVL